VLLQLKWIVGLGATAFAPAKMARRRSPERLLVALLAIVSIAALVIAVMHLREQQPPRAQAQFEVPLPHDTSWGWDGAVVVSPDGQRIVFTAQQSGTRRLFMRRLDDPAVTALHGTEGARRPFWSPDSRFIGFVAGDTLKRIPAAGGPPVTICSARGARDASWNATGVIIFAVWHGAGSVIYGRPSARLPIEADSHAGIYRVSDAGGSPERVTTPAAAGQGHVNPIFLPDGRRFLYAAVGSRSGVYVGSLDGAAPTLLLPDVTTVRRAPGYLLFMRGESLLAQPFDDETLRLSARPMALADDVGWGRFSASDTGLLVYGSDTGAVQRLQWLERDGTRRSEVGEPGRYGEIVLSPTATKVAVYREGDLWMLDLATGVFSRLTSDPHIDSSPAWSPDERRMVFSSGRAGYTTVFEKDLVTGREERVLADTPPPGAMVDDWSPDGKFVIFRNFGRAIYALPMVGERTPRLVADTPYVEDQLHVSPDSRRIAFQADESGRLEIYVASFPAFTDRRQVSIAGGVQPLWRRDGKELYFLGLDGTMYAVPIPTAPTFAAGAPAALFRTNVKLDAGVHQYGVTAGGQQFLILEPARPGADRVTVVLDWTARLPHQK